MILMIIAGNGVRHGNALTIFIRIQSKSSENHIKNKKANMPNLLDAPKAPHGGAKRRPPPKAVVPGPPLGP